MHTLRDFLVCGPAAALLAFLRESGAGWGASAASALALYATLRLLARQMGLDRAIEERRGLTQAARLARLAAREVSARSGGRRAGDLPAQGTWALLGRDPR